MKKLFTLLLIAVTLIACNKDQAVDMESRVKEAERTVQLTVVQGGKTRVVGDATENGKYAVISSGYIALIDDTGASVYQRELSQSEIDIVQNTESTSTTGQAIIISGVPQSAKKLYFIANVKSAITPDFVELAFDPMPTAPLSYMVNIDQVQTDAEDAPMAGLSPEFVLNGDTYETTVELTPLVSRIEIGEVSYTPNNPATGVDISSFKLAGIFINNIYPSVNVDGTPSLRPIVNSVENDYWTDDTQWPVLFENNPDFPYYERSSNAPPLTWKDYAMVDYFAPAAGSTSFYPHPTDQISDTSYSASTMWTYHVVPSSPTQGSDDAPDTPHIIIKLTDVEYVSDATQQPVQYITVDRFKTTAGDPITEFTPGSVYRINSLSFSNENATDKPYADNISVEAKVTVMPWIINEVEPDWGN